MWILKKFLSKKKSCNDCKDEIKLLHREVSRLADLVEGAIGELKALEIQAELQEIQERADGTENNDEETVIWGT